MHPQRIIAALALPPDCRLDQRIPKKLLLEHGAPTAADKRRIQEGIEEVHWVAALKPATVSIAAFRDATRDYSEIAVLVTVFRPEAKPPRLLELMHRAIPYPLALIALETEGTTVSLAHKRFSQAEGEKVVVESLCSTPPLTDEPTPAQEAFLDSLALSELLVRDLYMLYDRWIGAIRALDAARITGSYIRARTPEQAKARETALIEYGRLEREIGVLRAQAGKEKQMNRRVDLNLAIQRLETELTEAARHL